MCETLLLSVRVKITHYNIRLLHRVETYVTLNNTSVL